MKGQAQELIWLSVIAMTVFLLSVFFYYQFGTKGIEVRKSVEEINLDEAATSSLITVYSNKLPFVEKFYIETAIDAILQGAFMKQDFDKVFYGSAIGKVNVTEIIPPLLNEYYGNRWELTIETPAGSYKYGNTLQKNEILYTYTFTLPVPEEKFGFAVLNIGKPK